MTDPQDPLPEASWLHRRLITFLVVGGLYALLWPMANKAPADDAARIIDSLLILIGVVLAIYLIAPSFTQLAQLAAALKVRIGFGGPDHGDSRHPPRRGPRIPDIRPPWERR